MRLGMGFQWAVPIIASVLILGTLGLSQDVFAEEVFVELQKLVDPDNFGSDFGRSVSVSGNLAIMGDFRDTEAGSRAGAAYIFEKDESINRWVFKQKLIPASIQAHDFFGWSVYLSGERAIVGSLFDNEGGILQLLNLHQLIWLVDSTCL